jgi:hypothetical protein
MTTMQKVTKPRGEKKVRFRANGNWGKWQSWDNKKIPKEIDAMETSELMTLREIEELRAKGVL